MKREYLETLEIVDGKLTKAALDAIMGENGKDIEAAKAKFADYDQNKADLKTAQTTIAELEKGKGDAAALQKIIDDYKAADEQRKEDEKKAAARAEVEARFAKALGDKREFSHDYIRAGVLGDFEKALAAEENKGKGDTEIFDALTKDKEGIFKSQNPQTVMGGLGSAAQSGNHDKMTDAEFYSAYYNQTKGK